MFINHREVSKRIVLPQGRYCIIPCTFNADKEGEFLLRVFVERSWVSSEGSRGKNNSIYTFILLQTLIIINPKMPTYFYHGSKHFLAKTVNASMDGLSTPTVDSITEGVKNIPIKADSGYRHKPSGGATDRVFGRR